jgi:hypothetical protein
MIIFVSTAHTVYDSYALRLRAIFENYFAAGGAYGIADSLEFEAGNDIR